MELDNPDPEEHQKERMENHNKFIDGVIALDYIWFHSV